MSVRLYTDGYGRGEMSFESAQVDLVTGQWKDAEHPTTSDYDYELQTLRKDKMPTSGDDCWLIKIAIPTRGVNFLANYPLDPTSSANLVRCPNWVERTLDGELTFMPDGWSLHSSKPSDWDVIFSQYWKQYIDTDNSKKFMRITSNDHVISTTNRVPPEWDDSNKYITWGKRTMWQGFWTFGMGYFSVANFWNAASGTNNLSNFVITGLANLFTTSTLPSAQGYWNAYWQAPGMGGTLMWNSGDIIVGGSGLDKGIIRKGTTVGRVSGGEQKPRMSCCMIQFNYPLEKTVTDEEGNESTVTEETKFIGILAVQMGVDGTPQSAEIVGATLEFWQPEGKVGQWGADTGVEGGEGSFNAPSDNHGDAGGADVSNQASDRNTALGFTAHSTGINVWVSENFNDVLGAIFTREFMEQFNVAGYDPASCFLALHAMPGGLAPHVSSNALKLHAGGFTFSDCENYNTIQAAIYNRHIGSRSIDTYYDGFADFTPYTKCYLHLPFCGVIEVDANYVMGGMISVDYMVDALSGNISAYVWCYDRHGNNQYVYNATGNCAYSLPIFSRSGASDSCGKLVNSAIGMIGSFASGVAGYMLAPTTAGASMALAGGTIGAMSQAASGLWNAEISARHGQVIGNVGANASFVTDGRCFLEVIRPQWANSDKYPSLIGIPSEISGTINSNDADAAAFGGYLKCKAVDVRGISGATEEELAEIESIMMRGFQIG